MRPRTLPIMVAACGAAAGIAAVIGATVPSPSLTPSPSPKSSPSPQSPPAVRASALPVPGYQRGTADTARLAGGALDARG